MIVKNKRTHTYKGTVNNDAEGLAELAVLRQEIKTENAGERLKALLTPGHKPKLKRVLVFGRLGKNNPNAAKYKSGETKVWRWSNAYQYIRKADAATLDLYIHPVYVY
jgi:hypothetical protein